MGCAGDERTIASNASSHGSPRFLVKDSIHQDVGCAHLLSTNLGQGLSNPCAQWEMIAVARFTVNEYPPEVEAF